MPYTPTASVVKTSAELYFTADSRLDASNQRVYKRMAPLVGGTERQWSPDALAWFLPALTGVVEPDIYSMSTWKKLFIGAISSGVIEQSAGYSALDPAGARRFAPIPVGGFPILPFLDPGCIAPGQTAPQFVLCMVL